MAQQFATVQQLFALNCELRREITSAAATVHHHPEFSDFLCQALAPCKACLQDLYDKQKTLESHIGALTSGLEQLHHAHLSLAAAPLEDAEIVKQNESKLALLQEQCRAKFSKQDAELRRLEDMIAGAGKSEIAGAHTSAEKSETAGADTMQEGASADQLVSRADLQELRSYELQGSIWDACMLIRFPTLGWFEDLHLLFGVLVNICCQGFFCLFVQANMTEEVVNELTVEAAKHWRSSIGHSVENVNALSGTSLVARLCAQDPATSAAAAQLSIYGDLDSFISPTSSHLESLVGNFLNGRTLCMFSLMLWYLTLSFDVVGNLKFACALFSLPRETRQLTFTDDSSIKIRSISASHCVLVILLSIIPRMVMTAFLGISGTHFLSYTSNTEELLLNAIALEFVLNIDEMIFEAMAPHRVRMLIGKLVPIEVELLKEKETKQCEGQQKMMINFRFLANMQTFARVLVIAVLLVVVDQTYLLPYRQNMQDVTKWLCDGRKDFAYAINKASGVVHFAATRPHSDVYPTGYAQEAVLDITGVLGTKSTSTPWYSNYQDVAYHHEQWQSVQEISAFDVEFSAAWPICFDVFDFRASFATASQAQQRALRSFLGNESLMSCSDVDISLCHESNMNFLRGSCPDYCGCDKPWSGNFFGTVSNGCPRACNQWNQEKLDKLMVTEDMKPYLEECQDVPSEILSAKKEWQWWASAFYDSIMDLDPQYFETMAYPKTIAIEMGCRFFRDAMELGSTPCNPETSPGRSGRFWCPSTCNCAAGMSECPGQISTCQCQMGSCSRLYSKRTGDGTMNCSSVRLQDSTCPAGVAA